MERRGEYTEEGPEPVRSLVRVLLVDDQQLVRAGLRSLLSTEQDVIVVGEADAADGVLDLCAKTHPDLLLVDSMLPEMGTPSLIREVRARYPATQVLAIAECAEAQCQVLHPGVIPLFHCPFLQTGRVPPQDCLGLALLAGARGTIRKTCSREELMRAIRTVAPGQYWMELTTALQMIDDLQHPDRAAIRQEHSEGLTPREVEVIRELIAGRSNKQISRALRITEQSVKNLISRVLVKLNLESRVQIAIYAVNTRLLERYASPLSPGP